MSNKATQVFRDDKLRLHRIDGPAIIFSSGNEEWWYKAQLHRIDGPALTFAQEWYIHGQKIRGIKSSIKDLLMGN